MYKRDQIKQRGHQRKYHHADKARAYLIHRRHQLKRLYGLTFEAYDALRESHNFACAVCGREEWECPHGKLHVDHDHKTGMIRGLLCSQCNTILGLASENPTVLHGLIKYLDRRII